MSSQWEHDTLWLWHPRKRLPLNSHWEKVEHTTWIMLGCQGLSAPPQHKLLGTLWCNLRERAAQFRHRGKPWAICALWYLRRQSLRRSIHQQPCSSARSHPNGHHHSSVLMTNDGIAEIIWKRRQLTKSFQARRGSAGGKGSVIPDSL